MIKKYTSRSNKLTKNNDKAKEIIEKIPEPHFTVTAKDSPKYKEECQKYLESIRKEYLNNDFENNKEKSLLGLDALLKYGTREDLEKYGSLHTKEFEPVKKYAQFVAKVGLPDDAHFIWYATDHFQQKTYSEEALAEILKNMKILMVDKAEPGEWLWYSYQKCKEIMSLTDHKNKDISDSAKAIVKRLMADNNNYM